MHEPVDNRQEYLQDNAHSGDEEDNRPIPSLLSSKPKKRARSVSTPRRRAKFSPNIVCISITQPGSPSLSFCDLPSLINQAGIEEEEYLIQFVRDVVVDYVKDAKS
ncbi:hypothetical protein J4E86_011800 [Alternaria arbusti]|uniref:uncharacterized protein n=1 Tax=Alternaria arbusti TaxID=232088 RepID=UPI00221F7BEF|nr:uncharacterized protein J4E86_011800 [Alternaria arbusti]KAI4926786.1 hypothetical protein J4E86_011800 [Alternaria arbusti]